jgi:hypothetical protein
VSTQEAQTAELNQILDELAYDVTAVRTAGLKRPDDAIAALDRLQKKVADARALLAGIRAER